MASPARHPSPRPLRRIPLRRRCLTPDQIAEALKELCARGYLEEVTDQGGTLRYRMAGTGKHR
jgi:hypothetical protein